MIDVKHGDFTYSIRWNHQPESPRVLITELEDGHNMVSEVAGHTQCTVWQMDDSEPIVHEGYALCSVKDTYNKETGRKVSLARAIQDLPKEVRTEIWGAYLARKS